MGILKRCGGERERGKEGESILGYGGRGGGEERGLDTKKTDLSRKAKKSASVTFKQNFPY